MFHHITDLLKEGGSTPTYCEFHKTQSKSNSLMKGKGSYGGASMDVFFSLDFVFAQNKENGYS